ncbi:hypothetical protein D3C72_1469300 [compost metagenome]
MRRQRPAVVFAFFRDIDLIAATRAVLVQPQRVGPGVHRHPLRIADAVGPDFRACACFIDERIICGHFALIRQAYHFPLQLIQILRRRTLIVFTQADKQIAFAVEHQSPAEVISRRQFWHLAEHHLESLDAREILAQAAISYRRARFTVVADFGVAEPDAARLFKIRSQHHV